MCGIAGIVSSTHVSQKLLGALLSLEYRGYDSCGIAVIEEGKINSRKDKGSVAEVDKKLHFQQLLGHIGIAHTRWATTGIPNQINAHPHLSCKGDFALVHNGIISNYRELREILERKGHRIQSQTDTEVLVHLIEELYYESSDIEGSLRKMAAMIEGTYALVLLSVYHPENIYCARKESPLIIGLGEGENYVASDHSAVLGYTRRVITILDGEYAVVNRSAVVVKSLKTGEAIEHEVIRLDWDPELSKKGGYPHFMLKEIHEQPTTVGNALGIEKSKIDSVVAELEASKTTYLVGVGTTYYVAMISQYYFSMLAGRFFPSISSDEFVYTAAAQENSLLVAFSQSGETYDTLQALRHAKKYNARSVGIINVQGSSMVREVNIPIMQGSGPEICVLSTKAALAQIIVSMRLANELGFKTGFLDAASHEANCEYLRALPAEIRRVINESKGFVNTIARKYAHLRNWLFIGKGIYSGIALESALKMKEVSYRHAEGMPGGFMKHGTIALIDENIGSIFFLPPAAEKELVQHTTANAEEIKARSGLLVGFGFGLKSPIFDDQIRLPETNALAAPILLMIIGQLFAYYSAVALNRNIDKPRSLAKSVTVA